MLVLLPPSEGKAIGGSGPAADPDALSLPELAPPRRRVLSGLVDLCEGDANQVEKARAVLGLSPGLRGEVARNAALRDAPALPAGELYTGVLYDALDLATLSPAARERARSRLLIFSGLWGAVGVADRIAPYRCAAGVKLPGLGGLGAFWRSAMAEALPAAAGDGLVLDLRSSAYAAMWKPKGELADRTATVQVWQVKQVDGVEQRSVVSHFNKATKGRLVRSLLEADADPATPQELSRTLAELGHRVECTPPAKDGRPWQLDVLVTEVH